MEKFIVIKCPKCGYEYLPAEIFYPDDFLGQPYDITRNENGEIEFFNGDSLNLNEEFTCEKCDCTFNIIGEINFKLDVNQNHSFDTLYETVIYKDRINLFED